MLHPRFLILMSETVSEKPTEQKRHSLLPVVLLVVFFSFLPVVGRYFLRGPLSEQPEYRLKEERITVPPPPEWVSKDFVQNVLRASGLDAEGSLLDESLPQKLSQAFSADPWVEEVRRVEIRYPSGAHIELSYRQPVALVAVTPQSLYPVDDNGVLLPTDYFIEIDPEKRHDYPVIEGIGTKPLGTVGTLWGDPTVHTAAQLAGIVRSIGTEMNFAKIRLIKEASPTGQRILGCIVTREGTEITWGRIDPDDPKNEAKTDRLRELVKLYQSLDNVPPGFRPINLTGE